MTLRAWLLAAAVLLLAGCTTLRPPPPVPADGQLRSERLQGLQQWEMRGRIAVQAAEGEGGQAGVRWQQGADTTRLRLHGPLGSGSYQLQLDPDRITVTDAAGERSLEYSGTTAAEDFMLEQFGWYFPVTSTRFWVLGLADPAAVARTDYGPDGRPLAIEQHGWAIRYQRYAEFDGEWLPTRLELENSRVRLRLVVQRWLLSPDSG